jgi:selenocysteine lyase/cysteine desulfurase
VGSGSVDATVPRMIPCQRHRFDLPADVAWLNNAYLSPMLDAVAEAAERGLGGKRRPWTVGPDDFFADSDRIRRAFAALIGADAQDVALVPAVSYGVAVAAKALLRGSGDRVVLLHEQFPSNVYAWRDAAAVVTVPRPADGDWTPGVLAAIDDTVTVVAVPHCHWTDGSMLDLEAVGARCRAAGVALVVDGTQSVGALPLDVAAVDPDYLVCAGSKWLLGPYGLGVLYVAPRRQGGPPLEQNWITRAGSEDFAGLVRYTDGLQPGAVRFDMGERSSFHLAPMLAAGLEALGDWGVAAIAQTLRARTDAIAARAVALGLSVAPRAHRAPHLLGLRFPAGVPTDLPGRLRAAGVHVSVRGDAIRVSPHLYTTDADVDRLFEVLGARA